MEVLTGPFGREYGAQKSDENPWKAVDNKAKIGAKVALPGFLALTAASVGIALIAKQFSN